MKRIITLLVLLTTSLFYAQTTGITYQAVIYNPTGEILPGNNNQNAVLANKDICLRFSIKDATTNLEYQETQKVKTDEFGMVNVVIGQGGKIGGYASNFDAILWNSTTKKLQVEMDTTGNCSVFIEVSDQDFSAVPFAYASKTAENVSGIVAIANGGTGASTVVGAKTNLGLNNVDNTSDANKPISTATQTVLDTKAPLASPALSGTPTVPTATIGTNTTQIANTAFVTSAIAAAATPDATATVKGKIKLTGDLGGTADAPTVPGLANKENTIAAGTTAQYYRGDKSWQTLDKATVGLGNVSNTADADKPVSTATQTALDAKEAAANKSTNPALGTSDDLFPTQKAVKTYVDNQISAGVVDATATVKGKIQLTGDLGGTADAPLVPGLAFKAPLNSPQFTGTPSLPTGTVAVTQAANDNSTAVATTAYVTNALSTANSNARSNDLDMAGNSISNALAIRAGNFQMVDEVLHPFFGGNDDNSVTILNRNNNVTQFVDGRTGSPILAITNSVNEEDEFGTPTPEEGKIGIGTTTPSEKLQVIGNIKSQSFIKENGTAGQFLKADGSVDANTYLTTTSATGTYEPIITAGTTAQYLRGDKTFQTLDKAAVGLGNVSNTTDADKPVSNDTQAALNAKENTVASGTTAQYYRGDKSWQTLDKAAVGLGNVSNTTDADKPVSTATQAALDAKEAAANKSANPTLGTSDDLFPTQKAVKTYVDNQISAGVVDATATVKGKIQLGGDLAGTGSTAAAPVITAGAVTVTKLANDAVEESKIKNGSVTTTKIADNAVTNAKLGEIVSVNKGGTGATSLTGYLKGNGTSAFTTESTIPVANVDGAVSSVNGVTPVNGNVSVLIGNVYTGNLITPTTGSTPVRSDIYIVAGQTGTPNDNGRTFIYDGTTWHEISTNIAALDNTFVKLSGSTMTGNLVFPASKKITIADVPTGGTDVANKNYVDGLANGKQNTITLTTSGTGAATLTGATLNIPTPNNGTVTEVSALTLGTSGTDITSTVATATTTPVVTLNVPTASAANRGALSAADWSTFNNKVGGNGTTNFVPKFSGTTPSKTVTDSSIFDDGTKVGIGTATPTTVLSVQGSANVDNANANTGTIANSLLFGNGTGEGIGSTRSGTTNIHGLNFFTSSDIRMAITNSGFIGLGTTSPFSPLSNTSSNIKGSDGQGVNGFSWSTGGSGYSAAIYNSGNTATHNGLAVKVANNAATTYAFDVSRGTAQSTAGTPLFNVLGNGNVGIGTASPANTLEIKQGTAGNSGLRFTNLTASSSATTSSNKVLGVDSNGDVILTNIPGTQNIVSFSTANPNTGSPVFTPNTTNDSSVVYQSEIDNSLWTYDGTTYVTYTALPSTAWNLGSTTNDAGKNKTSSIWRSGGLISGGTSTSKVFGNLTAYGGTNFSGGVPYGTASIGLISNTTAGWTGSGFLFGNSTSGSNAFTATINNDKIYQAWLTPANTYNLTSMGNATGWMFGSNINAGLSPTYALEARGELASTSNAYLATSGGKVGIGTTTPYSQLANTASTIQGSVISSVNGGFNWVSPGTGFAHSVYSSNSIGGGAQVKVAGNTSNVYAFEVSQASTQTGITTPLFNVIGNGNIGVGTSSPAAQLHTTGSIRFAGAGTPGVGKILTSDASGNATWQSTVIATKTADYILTANDYGSVLVFNSATTVLLTIPSSLSAGFYCQVIQQGTGQVNVVGASGVTVTSALGSKTRTTGSSIGILLTTGTSAFLSGDTSF